MTENISNANKPWFGWTFNLGHLVQVMAILAGGLGVYYGLVNDVQRNTQDILFHAKAIEELKAQQQQIIELIRSDGERREERLSRQIGDIKNDVGWLVRQRAGIKE